MSAIVSHRHYTHPRFMDASFKVEVSRLFGARYKAKLQWYVRGEPVWITTKHEIPRVNEFVEVGRWALAEKEEK